MERALYSAEDLALDYDVPRGTLDQLRRYASLLCAAQQRINLVGPATVPDLWRRHMLDSAQLSPLLPEPGASILDIGSGAGFPALVLAILGHGPVTMAESVGKKARFLQSVLDALDLGQRAAVYNGRVEAMPPSRFDVITARACANLAQLFDWGAGFAAQSTLWVLPKGENVAVELADAHKDWLFDAELHDSRSDSRGRIVIARHVRRRRRP